MPKKNHAGYEHGMICTNEFDIIIKKAYSIFTILLVSTDSPAENNRYK